MFSRGINQSGTPSWFVCAKISCCAFVISDFIELEWENAWCIWTWATHCFTALLVIIVTYDEIIIIKCKVANSRLGYYCRNQLKNLVAVISHTGGSFFFTRIWLRPYQISGILHTAIEKETPFEKEAIEKETLEKETHVHSDKETSFEKKLILKKKLWAPNLSYFWNNYYLIPTQDTKPSLGRRPKDGFVSKWVYKFLPAKNLCTYQDISNIT